MLLHTIVLKNHKPLSWNKLYPQAHWSYRQILAREIHSLMRAALVDAGIKPYGSAYIIKESVRIFFTAHTIGRGLDPDNVCTKIYIDALKGILLTDDNAFCVEEVSSKVIPKSATMQLEIAIYGK